MHLSVRTIAEFYVFAILLLAAFGIVGLPLKLLLSVVNRDVSESVSTPILGASVIIVVSWWWYGPLGPLRPVPWILLVIGTVAGVVLAIVPRTRQRLLMRPILDVWRRSSALLVGVCLLGTGALFFVEQGQLFSREHMSVFTLGNNDAADYAMVSQHQLDESQDDPGPVAGYDFGFRASWFAGGSAALLAAAASLSGFDVWKVMAASLFGVVFLGVYSLALLLRRLLGVSEVVHALLALAGFGVVYMQAVIGQWFFAELLGIAVTFTCIGVLRAALDSRSRVGYLTGGIVLVLLLHAGLWIYPHMVVAGSIVLLPVAAISLESWRVFATRALICGAMFASVLVFTVILAPGLAHMSVDVTQKLANVDAGTAQPPLLPTELLGFQSIGYLTSPAPPHGVGSIVVSALLMMLVVALAVIAWRRGWRRPVEVLLVAVAVILVSYLIVYLREGGPSYRQWKWITFFVPLFVASILAIAVGVADRLWKGNPIKTRATGGLLGFIGLTMYIASPTSIGLTATNYSSLTLDQITIADAPALEGVDNLHIDVGAGWDTMWLTYFLRDRELTLHNFSYWPVSPPAGDLWIQRVDSGPLAEGFEPVAELSATYRLVRKL